MAVAVSVVVIARDFRSELDQLIESLDHQSLPTDAFEVVVVDTGSTDGTLERLQKMVTRRPNVTLVEANGSGDVQPTVPLEHCRGEYVLRLQPSQILFPEALERMHAEAVRDDLEALSSRVCETASAVPDLWTADDPRVDPRSVATALAGPAVLMRRSLLDLAADPHTDRLAESTRVGVLSSYPALLQPADPTDAPAGTVLSVDVPVVSWNEGRLQLSVAGSISTADGESDLGSARPAALVRETHTGQSFWLGSGEPGRLSADGRWNLTLDVDLRTVAVGGDLPEGVWEIDVQLVGVGDLVVAPVVLPWTEASAAVLGSLMVVPAPSGPVSWQLDVGPTTWPLVATPDPANATVTETAVGSLLVLALPELHVSGSTVIEGALGLEALRLPAKLITDGTSARVEAYVSGLEGAPRIGTQFGVGAYKQTGLRLEIAHIGEMVVARVPAPAPKPAAAPAPPPAAVTKPAVKKAPAKKTPAKKATPAKVAKKKPAAKPLTRVQHLRRALPSRLDPVARKISKNPLARQVYRKIANL